MTEVILDATSAEAAIAPRTNMIAYFRQLERSRGAEFVEVDGVARWMTALHHPWFCGSRFVAAGAAGRRAASGRDGGVFRDKGVDVFTWWLDPAVEGTGWEELLGERGFGRDEGPPGMVIDLGALPPLAGGELEIERVTDDQMQGVWARTAAAGYGMPSAEGEALLGIMNGIGLELPIANYLGRLDGEAVGCSQLFLGAGVAGIYTVATLREARGRGVGAALTLAPLYDARELGYRVGILQSSEMGYRVYERLGFRTTCRVGSFYRELRGYARSRVGRSRRMCSASSQISRTTSAA